MSNKNPPDINELLKKIGLMPKGKPLATVRGIQDNHYDLSLHIDPETAAERVAKILEVEANYYEDDGCYYWEFRVDNEWDLCFEIYSSGNEYLTIVDLRPPKIEKPIPISIVETSNNYQILKQRFKEEEEKLTLQLKENFEEQMVEMLKQVPSVKSLVWAQYSMWQNDMEHDFTVYRPHFLSFIPEELKEYYDDSDDLPSSQEFILTSIEIEKSQHLSAKEKEMCVTMREIILNNDPLFKKIFGDHIILLLTKDGLKTEHYNHLD